MNKRYAISAAAALLPLVLLPFDAAVIIGSVAAVLAYRWFPRIPDAASVAAAHELTIAMPIALDVMSLALDAGLSWDRATRYAAAASPPALRTMLERAATRLALGADPHEVWTGELRQIAVVVERSFRSGAPVSQLLRQQADALRADERLRRIQRSRRLGEQVLIPVTMLGMPGFFLLALLPTLASIGLQLSW